MKIGLDESFEFGLIVGLDASEAIVDAGGQVHEGFVINIGPTLLRDKLPQAFDPIQVRRVTRKEPQRDVQLRRQTLHEFAMLIPRIVQNNHDVLTGVSLHQPSQQLANRRRRDGTVVGHRRPWTTDRVERTEHVPTLATRRAAKEHSRETPQATQERRLHEMRGIHKQQHRLTGLCTRYFRLQNVF